MAKKKQDQVATLIADVEAAAKRLRADVRRRAQKTHLPRNLQKAANDLRKRAARAVAQVEKYVHQLHKELESGALPAAKRRKSTKASKRKA